VFPVLAAFVETSSRPIEHSGLGYAFRFRWVSTAKLALMLCSMLLQGVPSFIHRNAIFLTGLVDSIKLAPMQVLQRTHGISEAIRSATVFVCQAFAFRADHIRQDY
jgi:hypothetical protein